MQIDVYRKQCFWNWFPTICSYCIIMILPFCYPSCTASCPVAVFCELLATALRTKWRHSSLGSQMFCSFRDHPLLDEAFIAPLNYFFLSCFFLIETRHIYLFLFPYRICTIIHQKCVDCWQFTEYNQSYLAVFWMKKSWFCGRMVRF